MMPLRGKGKDRLVNDDIWFCRHYKHSVTLLGMSCL